MVDTHSHCKSIVRILLVVLVPPPRHILGVGTKESKSLFHLFVL